LTAKSTLQDKVKGLDTGADAYITKPFEPPYLLALIKSQLSNREKVQMILSATTKAEEIDNDILSPQDNIFMKELYDLMESEISNSELDIIKLTDMMKISRSKFYYKVKGLTGETPAVFFRSYKLNRAAELLKEGKYNISEVADLTGFTSLSHFSTSFKKQFGISPSDYK
jgi:AraC-like DNA-binding protein